MLFLLVYGTPLAMSKVYGNAFGRLSVEPEPETEEIIMSMDVYTGRKFNANHQLAILLTRHLGIEDARREARKNGWSGVLMALNEQRAIVTRPC